MTLTFDVIGVPTGQGSMHAFNGKGGKAMMKPSGGSKFAQWRNAVSEAARTAMDGRAAMDGALRLDIKLRFPMPASRSKAMRTAGAGPKTTAPDVDKCARLIADSLTAANAIVDDSRIMTLTVSKYETTGWTGATITVRRMDCEATP